MGLAVAAQACRPVVVARRDAQVLNRHIGVPKYPSVPGTASLLPGDPRPALTLVSQGAQLIVVGCGRRDSLHRSLPGSAGQHLLPYAPCPVAVVRGCRTGPRRTCPTGPESSEARSSSRVETFAPGLAARMWASAAGNLSRFSGRNRLPQRRLDISRAQHPGPRFPCTTTLPVDSPGTSTHAWEEAPINLTRRRTSF